MTPAVRAEVAKCLGEYGRSLSADSDEICKDEKGSGVFVTAKRGRLYAKTANGRTLWSGSDIGAFVEPFWLCKPKQAEPR